MQIEVWRKRPFQEAQQLRSGLTMFLHEGRVHATWKNGVVLVRTSLYLPVSDKLAKQVMGAVRKPCSYVGKQPTYSLLGKPGFTCRDKTIGEDCYSVEHCTECGLDRRTDGNPRFRAFVTGGEYSVEGHPPTTRLEAPVRLAEFDEADWGETFSSLSPSKEEGRLIVWVIGFSAHNRAGKTFPDAELVWEQEKYAVLTDCAQTDRVAS